VNSSIAGVLDGTTFEDLVEQDAKKAVKAVEYAI
jgi:hypothetical protein